MSTAYAHRYTDTGETEKKKKKSRVEKLTSLIEEVDKIASMYDIYIEDPQEMNSIEPREVSGVVMFKKPIKLSTLIINVPSLEVNFNIDMLYHYDTVMFGRFSDLSLSRVEFYASKEYLGIRRRHTVTLLWRGREINLVLNNYTSAMAFLLMPEVYRAIYSGEASFSTSSVEDFVNIVLSYSAAIAEKGLHRFVKLEDIFGTRYRGSCWWYIVDFKKTENIVAAGLGKPKDRNIYYVVLIDDSLSVFYSVFYLPIRFKFVSDDIKKYPFSLDVETVSRLSFIKKLIEELEQVKRDAMAMLELYKIAYMGVKSYVS